MATTYWSTRRDLSEAPQALHVTATVAAVSGAMLND
jgi:hypothetical protein